MSKNGSRNKELQCGKGNGIGVVVKDNNVEAALRIFKKKIKNEGVLIDYKNSLHYEKPSEKRRRERLVRKIRAKRNSYR